MIYGAPGLITTTFVQWPNWSANNILCPTKTPLKNQLEIGSKKYFINCCNKSNIVILDKCSWRAVYCFFLTMACPKKWHKESAANAQAVKQCHLKQILSDGWMHVIQVFQQRMLSFRSNTSAQRHMLHTDMCQRDWKNVWSVGFLYLEYIMSSGHFQCHKKLYWECPIPVMAMHHDTWHFVTKHDKYWSSYCKPICI